ncbi:membrane protein [Anaerocolumna cellulosilytica]|uniref:Membrane protein n=1 Tax=Anaerocolumna cellulosilytica TaxID=433286 RepID=A0A6S6QY99_9FIRM|nr:ECF transporter S component [Anaerocolumna cellulosilytica]MBB5197242.1 energy-coupling factor transport system substrate-specific component [Anaerocolumna cellulosilytica]BCJ94049.1 membrane protein [Anaerocolumna cellulosilytica]
MKKASYLMVMVAFASVINMLGGQLALLLRLPIYLDAIGTFFAACLLGPVWGMVSGIISGLLTGITMDIYSVYFIPVQLLTGLMAGILYKTPVLKSVFIPIGIFMVTLPGTLAASVISSLLFGGYTSSGSSMLVFLLRTIGFGDIASIFFVQFVTDYIDRILSLLLVISIMAALPKNITEKVRRGRTYNGKI